MTEENMLYKRVLLKNSPWWGWKAETLFKAECRHPALSMECVCPKGICLYGELGK